MCVRVEGKGKGESESEGVGEGKGKGKGEGERGRAKNGSVLLYTKCASNLPGTQVATIITILDLLRSAVG